MSRIGKKPIALPEGVAATVTEGEIKIRGPKGELARRLPPYVELQIDKGQVVVSRQLEGRRGRAMHGLARALISNMVTGVSEGFSRTLEVNGVGYRADAKGRFVTMALGFSHPIEIALPSGIEAKVEKNQLQLWGVDKECVGQFAAIIRDQRPPEPYKGKGVKYLEEQIRRKVGKAGVSSGA